MSAGFEPIAVVGMAGRFPGALDVNEFWANLAAGKDSITRLSKEDLIASGVPAGSVEDPSYVKAAPLIAGGAEGFDAPLFRMTPREATVCEPQLRLFLETTHAAIENAGYDPSAMPGAVGVFGSTSPCHYVDLNVLSDPAYQLDMSIDVLTNADYLATFTSYKLDLHGPSMTVLSACSSSLSAIHLACQSLATGESDLAVAGGANIMYPYRTGYRWAPGGVQSPDGHCRPFDAAAAGTVFGDGVGVVVLKRLDDAVLDGDTIRAVVRGTAVNNDGADKVSFSAPSLIGQSNAVFEAMSVAGWSGPDIDYVEAHGTGTALGDPIEVAALTAAYRLLGDDLPAGAIAVGSVKSNIGHLVAAAGIAGFIKTVLALERGQLPATAHFQRPNPALDLASTPFRIADRTQDWPTTQRGAADRPRRAGVSSLGVGGTNAHVLLEAAPEPVPIATARRPRIVVWSALDSTAEQTAREHLAEHFTATAARGGDSASIEAASRFADVVATLQRGRAAHPVRGALISADADHAAQALRTGLVRSGTADPRPVVFAFPGQGAARARMAAGLYGTQRTFTEQLDTCLDAFEQHGLHLYDAWLDPDGDERVRETGIAQPLLFSIEYALARTWLSWGIVPSALVGHSLGEIVAATVAGVFDLPDATAFVAARASAMQQAPAGAMLALRAAEEDVRAILPPELVIAAVNAPDEVVISGSGAAVQAFDAGGLPGRILPTSHGFHSPAMAAAVPAARRALDGIRLRPPTLPLWSAATGGLLSAADATDPDFWAGQISTMVRFADAARELLTGPATMIEVGPGRTLGQLARRAHPELDLRALASLPRPESATTEETHLLGALAELWVAGHDVDWAALEPDRPLRRVPVPGYPYQRTRHWVDSLPATPEETTTPPSIPAALPDPAPAIDPTAGEPTSTQVTVPVWLEVPRPVPTEATTTRRPTVALVPAEPAAAMPLVAALQRGGHDVIRVRPGAAFAVHGDPDLAEYTVRPGDQGDLARVFDHVHARGIRPEVLVHAWAATSWPRLDRDNAADAVDRGLHALRVLVQEGLRGQGEASVRRLLVLTERAVDVSGADDVEPVKAALVGAIRALDAELPTVTCRLVDVAGRAIADELADEVRAPAPVLTALRGPRRWLPAERAWQEPADREPVGLRAHGIYVITGGLGGLGIQVALGLARTGLRPHLVLLGRHAPSEQARSAIGEMELLGATVRVGQCDVADPASVRATLADVRGAAGPISGVLHLAGVAGGGVFQLRDRAKVDTVLRAKVYGTLALFDVLADAPLDFFCSFSSRAAIGASIGNCDYGAANAVLDALTVHAPGPRGRRLSVNWPAWAGAGMAVELLAAGTDVDGTQGGMLNPVAATAETAQAATRPEAEPDVTVEVTLAAETAWALDEHRLDGVPIMPGTGHLDLVVRTYRERVADAVRAPVALADIVFTTPMAAERARTVVVTLTAERTGAHRFRVGSRPADQPLATLVEHATGTIALSSEEFGRCDVDALRAGFPEPDSGSRPTNGGRRGFLFGPRWMSVRDKWIRPGEVLLDLALPAAFVDEAARYELHPALLDLATGIASRFGSEDVHLPFHYQRLTVHGILPPMVLAHVRGHSEPGGVVADIDLYAPDGSVVAAVRGFRMRGIESGAGTGDQLTAPEPAPTTPPEDRAVPAAGIAVDTGIELLLRLLAGPTPPQLHVRPHLAGQPVPLPAPVAAQPEAVEPAPAGPTTVARSEPVDAVAPTEQEPVPAPDVAATPLTEVELRDRLAQLWRETLGIGEISVDDHFFELGGDSLSALRLISRIRDLFGTTIGIGMLFDFPTLAALAAELGREAP
ncbi:MAG TPA: SDR family NAD(P)-dependent oxidoreductase [Pseudonocardiaceae bacterium]